jgi:TP901 family phage tail tape measure protein
MSLFTTNWKVALQDFISPGLGKINAGAQVTERSIAELRKEVAAFGRLRTNVKDPLQLSEINRKLDQAKLKLKELQSLGTGPKGFGAQFRAGVGQGLQSIPGVGGFLGAAGSAGPIAAGVLAAGAGIVKVTTMALDFETALGKINTTALLSKTELKGLGNELLALSARSTTGPIETANAYEKIISATGDYKLSLDILKASLKGAEAGFADVNTVADAVTNTMNSFGASKTNATEVLNVLLGTKRAGKGEFNDIAANIATVAANAKNANASLFEMGGAFATLTSAGFGAEESAVRLSGIYREIVNPKTVKAFDLLGVKIFDQNGKFRGLVSVAGDLKKALAGLTDQQRADALSNLGLESRAAAGLNTLVESYDRLKNSVHEVTNSQNELNLALEAGSTTTKVLQQLSAAFQVEMLSVGQDFKGLFEDLLALGQLLGPVFNGMWQVLRLALRTAIDLVRFLVQSVELIGRILTLDREGAGKVVGRMGALGSDYASFLRAREAALGGSPAPGSPVQGGPGAKGASTPSSTAAGTSLAPAGGARPAGSSATGGSLSGGGSGRSVVINMPVTINAQGLQGTINAVEQVLRRLIDEARNAEVILSSPAI